MSLELEVGVLEWDFFVVEVVIGVVGLDAVLRGIEVSLVMCIGGDSVW